MCKSNFDHDHVNSLLTNEILELAIRAQCIDEIYECLKIVARRKKVSQTDLLILLVDRVIELKNGCGTCSGNEGSQHPDDSHDSPRTGNDAPSASLPEPEPEVEEIWYWPTTLIIPRGPDGEHFDDSVLLRDSSGLAMCGYRTGKTNGLGEKARRNLLTKFMTSQLNPRIEEVYGDEYGHPKTMKRLMKVAHTLASLCKLMKRKENAYGYRFAIEHYEDDLDFLYHYFYIPMRQGRPALPWPSTDVDSYKFDREDPDDE